MSDSKRNTIALVAKAIGRDVVSWVNGADVALLDNNTKLSINIADANFVAGVLGFKVTRIDEGFRINVGKSVFSHELNVGTHRVDLIAARNEFIFRTAAQIGNINQKAVQIDNRGVVNAHKIKQLSKRDESLKAACVAAGCPEGFDVHKLPEFLVAVTARMHELELQNAAQAVLLQERMMKLSVSDGSVVVCVMPADQIEAGTAIFAHLRSVLPASVKCLVHADNVNIYSLNEEQMRRSGWVAATVAAKWREAGESDPHGELYNCERAGILMGHLTDDQFANELFLYDHRCGLRSLSYLQAAKDRIRWLSRKLAAVVGGGAV